MNPKETQVKTQAVVKNRSIVSKVVAGSIMALFALTSTSSVYALENEQTSNSNAAQAANADEVMVSSFCGPIRYCPPIDFRPGKQRYPLRLSNAGEVKNDENIEVAARSVKPFFVVRNRNVV